MISERQLARGFSGFWQELLPLLTPRFVRLFNEGYVRGLNDAEGAKMEPQPVGVENENPGVVAEMAFYIAKLAHKESKSIAQAAESADLRAAAMKLAIALVEEYEGEKSDQVFELSQPEIDEAIALALRYEWLYPQFSQEAAVEYSPSILGAGFIPLCDGDLSIGETLIEIKTVNRNFSGKDLRQLIIYLALQASTGKRRWTSAGFFNPRRGVVAEFAVDAILLRLSGGKTPSEVFEELISFASSREVLFDATF